MEWAGSSLAEAGVLALLVGGGALTYFAAARLLGLSEARQLSAAVRKRVALH
jgi:hypothetical protein